MTTPSIEIEEGQHASHERCDYCGDVCSDESGWATDNDGTYHWACVPSDTVVCVTDASRAGQVTANRIDALAARLIDLREMYETLAQAHHQHRASDRQFLASLGKLTEAVQRLEAKLDDK